MIQQQNQNLSGISDVFCANSWLDLINVSTCHSVVKHTSGNPICHLLPCQWKWDWKKSFSLLWSSIYIEINNVLRQLCNYESRMICYACIKDMIYVVYSSNQSKRTLLRLQPKSKNFIWLSYFSKHSCADLIDTDSFRKG